MSPRFVVRLAGAADTSRIAAVRRDVYVDELGQYSATDDASLTDATESATESTYIVAERVAESVAERVADRSDRVVVGCIAVTLPGSDRYGLDRHFDRRVWAAGTTAAAEIRTLAVSKDARGEGLSKCLVYAAIRMLEEACPSDTEVLVMTRVDELCRRLGMVPKNVSKTVGKVVYGVYGATLSAMRATIGAGDIRAIAGTCVWDLPFGLASACFHGGTWLTGKELDASHMHEVIRENIAADVLDAWYPPSPRVLDCLGDNLEWCLKSSPAPDACGLIRKIADARGVPSECVAVGAGSSDLIYRCFLRWLTPSSTVLIVKPTYGEYEHVCALIGCNVVEMRLSKDNEYNVQTEDLAAALHSGQYDLVVVVNPNNPTGRYARNLVPNSQNSRTRVWIDETYVDFVEDGTSLESVAAASPNVVVCKSMSKYYALSGARVAYLVGPPAVVRDVREITPPWAVSMVAQLAATRALEDPEYYASRKVQTESIKQIIVQRLRSLGFDPLTGGVGNFVTAFAAAPVEATLEACRRRGVHLRNVSREFGRPAIRVAVKSPRDTERMLSIIELVHG